MDLSGADMTGVLGNATVLDYEASSGLFCVEEVRQFVICIAPVASDPRTPRPFPWWPAAAGCPEAFGSQIVPNDWDPPLPLGPAPNDASPPLTIGEAPVTRSKNEKCERKLVSRCLCVLHCDTNATTASGHGTRGGHQGAPCPFGGALPAGAFAAGTKNLTFRRLNSS